MGTTTNISWTEATWNPLRGCTVVSEGCKNCYAMDVAARFSGEGLPYEGLAYKDSHGHAHWTGEIMLVRKHLLDPIRWQKPRMIFVNSMSDLFHPNVPEDYIWEVFAVMSAAQRHIFQVLTKRPERMQELLSVNALEKLGAAFDRLHDGWDSGLMEWPLPNVWLGTSVELQKWADVRIPLLLQTPAAVRFLSCEPLLGPLSLKLGYGVAGEPYGVTRGDMLHWIIVGGESGRYYRPMDLDWARDIQRQCEEAGVAFFYKQDSGLRPGTGATLDGVEYHEFPKVTL